jgi:hypothetical protein
VGGGALESLVQAAVLYWQSAYLDPFTVSIQYGWFNLPTSVGTHVLLTEGGTPHRETSGSIAFDNDLSTVWFVDPTPASASEFTTFTPYTANLGGGTMNVGREYTGGTGSAASHDLFSTVLHEIGHALGMSGANNAYVAETSTDTKIDIASPYTYAGADLPVNSGNAHLNMDHTLMRSSRPSAMRRLPSDADILANAQISQFGNINLNAQVPEPSTIVLAAAGAVVLVAFRHRLRVARR